MNHRTGSRIDSGSRAPAPKTDEDARLDEAMQVADERLVASLKQEELRRRRVRRWTFVGGLLMAVIATAVVTALVVVASMGPIQNPKAVRLAAEGWKLWGAGDKAAAEASFAEAVEIDPEYANAWNGLGWSRMNLGDTDGAEKAFVKCVKLQDGYPGAHNGLGYVYFGRRQYDKAEKHWLKVASQANAAWPGLAKLYLLQGQWKDAEKWAEKAAAQEPGDKTLKRMLAAAQAQKLDSKLRAEIQPPESGGAASEAQKGWALFQRGQFQDAAKAFEAALKADPDNPAAHNGLGFCLLNMGKPAEAKPHFQKALETWPEGGGPLNGLARCLKAEGKVDEAINLWKKVAGDPPTANAGTYGLAETYLELGRYKEAVKYWEVIAKAQPNDPHVRETLERARRGLKQRGDDE
jgi:tetratricopeptide (TPR) repeat protein